MTGALPLSEATLARHARRVRVPVYDRWSLTPSVVHISVGSFHRSHQAVYFDEIAQRGISTGWGLTGVGMRRPRLREALSPQDGLYTVVARGAAGADARIVGVMGRYLFAPENDAAVLAMLADPRTRLVTLTVTGAGYRGPVVDHLVAALDLRRRAQVAPFTVLSCDNLPDNGVVAREAVLAAAGRRDPALAAWIGRHGAFPSSMVDRITPQTTDADRAFVAEEFGVADRWPVMTEPFSQWIIEDRFCHGRPPLDEVGAQYVPDVRPYSLMKTRLLNGSHCALGPLGSLLGHERIDEAIADPRVREFTERMMVEEIAPLLDPVPGIDLERYRRSLLARFANPCIGDRLERLCRNGSGKVPQHLLSSIAEARAAGRPHHRLTLAVAGWMRYLRDGNLDDPLGDRLQALAREGGADPRPLLSERRVFGDLGGDAGFAAELGGCLAAFDRDGVGAALAGLPLAA